MNVTELDIAIIRFRPGSAPVLNKDRNSRHHQRSQQPRNMWPYIICGCGLAWPVFHWLIPVAWSRPWRFSSNIGSFSMAFHPFRLLIRLSYSSGRPVPQTLMNAVTTDRFVYISADQEHGQNNVLCLYLMPDDCSIALPPSGHVPSNRPI